MQNNTKKSLKSILGLVLAFSLLFTYVPDLGLQVQAVEEIIIDELPIVTIVPESELDYEVREPEINPDYIHWENGEDFGGLIPEKYLYEREPINVKPFSATPFFMPFSAAATLPEKYDPRNESAETNALTPAKNQSPWGTCWAFAAIGALESFVEKNSPGDTDPDFSELHMAFATSTVGGNPYATRPAVNSAGDIYIAASYLTRQVMAGPVLETNDPYPTTIAESSSLNSRNISITSGKPRAGIVTGMVKLANLSSGSPGEETSHKYINDIKQLVRNYGAATVSYYSNSDWAVSPDAVSWGYARIKSGEYQDQYAYHVEDNNINHAVIIIGWDDNFPKENFAGTKPAGNGAWLIKNSWNTDGDLADGKSGSGHNSYFWMSYYTNIVEVWAVTGYDNAFSDAIYDYTVYSDAIDSWHYLKDTQTVYVANIFDAEDTATALKKVQFYNRNEDSNYEIYVAVGDTDKTGDDVLLAQAVAHGPVASGHFDLIGYYTIDLTNANIALTQGKTFAVVIKSTITFGDVRYGNTYNPKNPVKGWGYYSADGLIWSGGNNESACEIRAIVADSSGSKGWTWKQKIADITAPTVELTSPIGTIDTMSGGNIVLKFSEPVTAMAGKLITVRAGRKDFRYDNKGNTSPYNDSSSVNFDYTIPNPLPYGWDNTESITIPFDSFVNSDNNLELFNNALNQDNLRAYDVYVEAGAFKDLIGNEWILELRPFEDKLTLSEPERYPIGGFFSKTTKNPTVFAITPANSTYGVPKKGNIIITFNTQLDKNNPGTVILNPGNIILPNGSWSGGLAEVYPDSNESAVSFTDGNVYTVPYTGLDALTKYTVTISGFKDPDGNIMNEYSSAFFTTSSTTIDSAAITVTAPIMGNVPDTTANGTGNFTIKQVMWTASTPPKLDTTFLGGSIYSVGIILTANPGYTFPETPDAKNYTINGNTATISPISSTELWITYQFPATEARTLTNMEILTQPAKLNYAENETLNLSGLSVKFTYNDGFTRNVMYGDSWWGSYGITTIPANGTVLTGVHNGTTIKVTLTYVYKTAETNALTVGTETVPGLTGIAAIDNISPRIGDTLNGSLVNGNSTGTLNYVWKAAGSQVGTGASYTVAAADFGKQITLEITSTVETGTVISSATSAVLKKTYTGILDTPMLESKTSNSVTLKANELYEFSINGSAWQTSNVFSGLNSSTTYTFYQRTAETADTEASASSAALTETTDAAPPNALTGTVTIDNTAPRIGDTLTASLTGDNNTGALSYTWKTDGTTVVSNSVAYTVTAADLGKTITVEINSSVETGIITSLATAAVAKKTPTVTWPTGATATYGQTLVDSVFQITAGNGTNNASGGFNWASPNDYVGNAGIQSHIMIFTPDEAGTYETLTQNINVTVNKADPIVNWPTGVKATYGQTLSSNDMLIQIATGNGTNNTPGEFDFASPSDYVGDVGEQWHDMTFNPDDFNNYNVLTKSIKVTVEKAVYNGTKTLNKEVLSEIAKTYTVTLPPLPDGASYGSITIKPSTGGLVENAYISDTTLTFDVTAQTAGAESVMTISVIGGNNYENYEIEVTVKASDTLKEVTPTAAIDFVNERLAGLEPGAEYTVNGAANTADGYGNIYINAAWFGQTVSIIKKGVNTDSTFDSDSQSLNIPARPLSPAPNKTDTTGGNSNGSLTDVNTAMEYKLNTASVWTDINGTSVTGLSAGIYNVRVKAASASFASDSVNVIIASSSITAYTVTVSGSYSPASGAGIYTQGSAVTIDAGSRNDYAFSGWTAPSNNVTFANPSDASTIFIMPADDVTVTANWSYTGGAPLTYSITYNANGGNGTMQSGIVTHGGNYTIEANTFTRSNYFFTGWNTQANGGGTPYAPSATITNVQANTALYAQWVYIGGSNNNNNDYSNNNNNNNNNNNYDNNNYSNNNSNNNSSNDYNNNSSSGYTYTNASIPLANTSFDKSSSDGINVTLLSGSYNPLRVKNGKYVLVKDKDYTVSGNKYTINPEYLSTLDDGEHKIVFEMNGGTNPELIITIKCETPKSELTNGPKAEYTVMKPTKPAGTEVLALPSSNSLILDDKEQTDFPAVNIEGFNWLKLRDLAALLNGTGKQFEIGYDTQTNTITITTGRTYTPAGDELQTSFTSAPDAVSSPQKLYVDGKLISVAAYNIDGYNYFRLRDIAILMEFNIIYDEETEEITLDLENPYSE